MTFHPALRYTTRLPECLIKTNLTTPTNSDVTKTRAHITTTPYTMCILHHDLCHKNLKHVLSTKFELCARAKQRGGVLCAERDWQEHHDIKEGPCKYCKEEYAIKQKPVEGKAKQGLKRSRDGRQ